MRAVLQRVHQAEVTVNGRTAGRIGPGILVLLGVAKGDLETDADYLLDRIVGLRMFPDQDGKMNRSLLDTGGALLIVSQFTLYGDCRKGRRPGFDDAAPPEAAKLLYEYFVTRARALSIMVETGEFQAMMNVSLVNHGPVTFILESKRR